MKLETSSVNSFPISKTLAKTIPFPTNQSFICCWFQENGIPGLRFTWGKSGTLLETKLVPIIFSKKEKDELGGGLVLMIVGGQGYRRMPPK